MSVKEFINNSLEKIHTIFPESCLEYQYKDISETHFIKISPKSYFSKEKFIDLDFELTDAFRDSDFDGSLCFLNDDSLVTLTNPSIIVKPKIIFGDSKVQLLEFDCPIIIDEIGEARFAMAA